MLITLVQVKKVLELARPLHLEGDVVRGREDSHCGKRNDSTLDNNHLIAEYRMVETLILELAHAQCFIMISKSSEVSAQR